MANRFYVGGISSSWTLSGTSVWSTTSGGVGGASVPTIVDSVFFDRAGTYNITCSGGVSCLDITVSAGTCNFSGSSIQINGSMSLIAGTTWSFTSYTTFASTTVAKTINTGGTSLSHLTFSTTGSGTWSLTNSLTTNTILLLSGTLNLNGFGISCTAFSTTGSTARGVNFGSNYITLRDTFAGDFPLDMATATNFSYTGPGGFASSAAVARNFRFGTTAGGSSSSTGSNPSPSLKFTGTGSATQDISGSYNILDFGTTTFTPTATIGSGTIAVNSLICSTGGTYTGIRINHYGGTTSPLTLNGKGLSGVTVINGLTLTETLNCSGGGALLRGTINLNGFDWTCSYFDGGGANIRQINFGSNYIVMTGNTSGSITLNMVDLTNFSFTDTGGGFKTEVTNQTRDINQGTTGGSASNAPSLTFIGSGSQTVTIVNGSWFKNLNFGTTGSSIIGYQTPTTTLNISGNLTFSSAGFSYIYGSVIINMIGTSNRTFISNSRSFVGFIVNTTTGTVTLGSACQVNYNAGTYTQTSGTLDCNGFSFAAVAANFNGGSITNYTAGMTFYTSVAVNTNMTIATIGTITSNNCTWTISSGITLTLSSGTINALNMSFTSATFNVSSGAILTIGGTLTQTLSNINFNGTISNSSAGTWSLVSGNLVLTTNPIIIGAFLSTGTATRSINFGTSGYISTTITGTSVTALDLGGTGLSLVGTTKFNYVGTPTASHQIIINTGALIEASAFDLSVVSAINTNTGLNIVDTGIAAYFFISGSVANCDFTGMNFIYQPGTLTIYKNYTIPATGGIVSGGNLVTFASTSATVRTITISRTVSFPLTFSGLSGTFNLGANLTTGSTQTTTIVAGTLNLNGFTLTTGIFASTGTTTRAIAFGTNNITLSSTVAATTVLSMATLTGFTYTGTGGFTSAMGITRTFTSGTTGGSASNAPSLYLTSGAAIPTITTGSWFNTLDFTGSSTTPAASVVNVNSVNLSIGGTYTNLGVTMVSTGTITNNGKAIAAFAVNNGAGTTTLSAALSCTTYTQTAGTIDFATFNLSCSGAASFAAGTLNNIGTISCTTWNETGIFALSSGTIFASTSFTITSGAFTYSSSVGTITTPSFVHTAGTVTVNQPLTLTGFYTLTAGTLTLANNLTSTRFITTGTGIRAIQFSTYQIILTGNNATIWDGGDTGITYTGTPTIVSNYVGSVGTRTINAGIGWTEVTAFDIKIGAAAGISLGTATDIVIISGNVKTVDFTGMLCTVTPAISSMFVYGDFTIPAVGGTVSASLYPLASFVSTSATARTITFGRAVDFSINFAGIGGTFNLGANLTTGTTRSVTLSGGTLTLNGFDLTTGIFASTGTTTRAIAFGTNNITLSSTVAATTVLSMATLTGFTYTGTGGFTSVMGMTRTFTSGTTGGSASNAPNLYLTSGGSIPTITTGSWFNTLDFTGTTSTPATTNVNVSTLVLATGGTYTSFTPTFISTQTFTNTFSKQLGGLVINIPGGTLTLGAAQTLVATATATLTAGTLNLNNFTLTTGIFSSNNTNTRSIAFGSGNIILAHTTAATNVLDMATTTNFTTTSTGTGGFTSVMGITRTFTSGTTGGSTTNAPNLYLTSGAAIPTIITGSWFNTLDFTGSTSTPSTTNVNVSTLVLATGGTYTSFTPTFISTQTWTPQFSKQLGGLGINIPVGTLTLGAAQTLTATATATLTAGTLDLNGFDLTTGIFSSNNTNTRSIAFGVYPKLIGSILLSNGSTQYLSITTAASGPLDLATGADNWTVELWAYPRSVTGEQGLFWKGGTGGSVNPSYALFMSGSGGQFIVGNGLNGGALVNFPSGTFAINTWHHVALVRNGSSFIAYINGVAQTPYTTPFTMSNTANNTLTIGSSVADGSTRYFDGNISNFRVTKGVAVYTGNFTVPTSPLITEQSSSTNINATTSSQTSLLLNTVFGANYLQDASSYAFAVTNNNLSVSASFAPYKGGNIILAHTTAGTNVLDMATTTNFTTTGTSGFTSVMGITRTFTSGTTGGSTTNAPNLYLTSGAAIPTITTGSWFNTLDFTGTTSTPATTNVNVSTLVLATGGTYTSFTPTFTRTQTWSGQFSKQLGGLGINIPGGTFTMIEAITLPVNATTTLVAGTLYLKNTATSNPNLYTGIFSSNNSNVRGVILERNIVITSTVPGTTVLDMANATNFSYTDNGNGVFFTDALITRTYNCGTIGTPNPVNTPRLYFSGNAGPHAVATFVTGSYFSQLDIGYYSGTPAIATLNVGGFSEAEKVAPYGTFTNLTINITGNGYIHNPNNNSTFPALTINNYPYVVKLGTNNTFPRAFTLISGTLGLNGYTCTIPTLISTGTLTREINGSIYYQDTYNVPFNSPSRSILTISAAGTAFSNASATGLTIKDCTISMISATAKTFAGGGVYAPTMTLNQGDVGALTVTGNNTFKDWTATAKPSTITVQAGSTQIFSNFSLSGIAGSLVTLNSSTAATKYNLVVPPGGPVNVNYLSIRDCNASRYPAVTGTAVMLMYAGANSTSVLNNTGWIFTAGPTNSSNMLHMFL